MSSSVPDTPAAGKRRGGLNFQKPVAKGLGSVQDVMLEAGVWAAKNVPALSARDEIFACLKQNLPYNSKETRNRYASQILLWNYGEEGTFSLPQAAWQAYQDETLLYRVLCACWALRMPVIRQLVLDEINAIEAGAPLPWERVQEFIDRNAVGGGDETNRKRIPRWLERMGFVERGPRQKHSSRAMVVAAPYFDATAFLIMLHAELAPEVRTVSVAEILAHPFWRCLGGRDPRQVREALTAAAAAGAIDRYTAVDQLEQVTTRYSLRELLDRRVRL